MDLFYWRSPAGNFGDDLNLWLWDRLLPGWRDWHSERLLVGVGTVLNAELLPERDGYLVVGSGCGFGSPPRLDEPGRWDIRCVRGPRTAELLGLPPELAVTDPAAMVSRFPDFAPADRGEEALFVPHCHSDLDPDYDWPAICRDAALAYQSPRAEAGEVIRRIAAARLVVTESMHGAIIADAFRVPWRAVSLTANFNDFKWRDWADSLGIGSPDITPLPRPVRRLRGLLRGRRGAPSGQVIRQDGADTGSSPLKSAALAALRRGQRALVASALRRVARLTPQLSSEGVTDRRLDRLEAILEQVRRDYGAGTEDSRKVAAG